MDAKKLSRDIEEALSAANEASAGPDEPCLRLLGPSSTLGGVTGKIIQHADSRQDGLHVVMFTVRQTRLLYERMRTGGLLTDDD